MSKKMQKQSQFSVGDVGRTLYEDPRGHIGCLNTKCHGYLWGAKKYSKEQLKQIRR